MFDKQFTLEEKIGQLIILGHREPTLTGHITNMISTYHIGGVLLTNDSFYRPKHIYQLTNYLQRYAGVDTPIWLGVRDHHKALAEKGMTATLPEAIVTAYNNRLYTKQLAELNGDELRAVGINVTVAPNVDFTGLNRESFMKDFRTKSQHAIAAVQGYHAASIEPITPVDSMLQHIFANQVANKGRVLLYAEKFFKTARSIVLSHENMMNPLMTNILKHQLDYDGIIVADFSHVDNNAQDILHAFKEGAHMVMLNDDTETQLTVMNDIITAVKNGVLTETEIDLALIKVVALKQLRQINRVERFDRDAFEDRHHQYLIDKILSAPVVE